MIIPAIDFQGGSVVQLVQGERLALRRDLEATLEQFHAYPVLQIIDLDAAKGEGNNAALVRRCCRAGYRVRVGGGIRTLDRARAALDDGAEQVILGSAAFTAEGCDFAFLDTLAPLGREAVMIAVDARGGQIATHGWRAIHPLTPLQAIAQLAPWCAEFLYTHVDTEGLMQGIPLPVIAALRAATVHRLSVAGGIATQAEIAALAALDCHAVIGMALYTGRLS